MVKYKMVVPCHFGLESVVKFEILKCGGENIITENGRVVFEGDDSTLAKCNLWIRSGERVLILLSEFDALTFDDLFEGVKSIDWNNFIDKKDSFPVTGWSLNSELKSIPDCQKIIKKAIVEKLKQAYNISWFDETNTKVQIRFSILKNKVNIMIDSSGAPLHKRGYRQISNLAPIKETLAAGIIDLARIRDTSFLIDPFCGSGTFLIEGAYKALNIAPGIARNFAAQKYDFINKLCFKEERDEAKNQIKKDCDFFAQGYDIDEQSVEIAKDNCRKAGVDKYIKIEKQDVKNFTIPQNNFTVICNPPYGERLLDFDKANLVYKAMGNAFNKADFGSFYIISSNEEFEKHFGKKATKKRKLYNGMLKCDLYMYY
ncbi:MAG: class I SAM-dependent RNA methyltransferase [Oscillospiraceae bacterium]